MPTARASGASPHVLLALAISPGDLWLLGNVLLRSVYTACLRWKPAGLHPFAFMFAALLAGMLSGLSLYAIDLAAGGYFEPTPGTVLGILFLAAFASILCYLPWERGVTLATRGRR